ncbi:MAG: protein kinase [Blastocatellia bacterium]|nr:protein kinase [Blastocatellia bacterium]
MLQEKKLASKDAFFWITLILASGMLILYSIVGSMIFRFGSYEKELGWKYNRVGDSYFISEVIPKTSAENKLKVGDKLLAINGDKFVQKNFWLLQSLVEAKRKIPINSFYSIDVERDGEKYSFTLKSKPKRDYKNLIMAIGFFFASLVFSTCGLLFGILKPELKLARLLTIGMFTAACFMLFSSTRLFNSFLLGFDYIIYLFLWLSFPLIFPFAYNIYCRFPQDVEVSQFWNLAKYFLYFYSSIFIAIFLWKDFYLINSLPLHFLFSNETFLKYLDKGFDFLIISTLFLLVAVMFRNYQQVKDLDQKRRIKWVIYGSLFGVIPTFVNNFTTFILNTFSYKYIIDTPVYFFFTRFSDLFITIIPIAFFYVIVKHQVFEINFVVRRGLQYLLAKNFLRAVLALEVLGVIAVIKLKPTLTIGEIFSPKSIYLYLVLTTIISFVYRVEITSGLDKRFFRKVYQREKVLAQLLDEIKKLNSIAEISLIVTNKLTEVLHPKSIYLFYRDPQKTHFTLGHSVGGVAKTQMVVAGAELMRAMRGEEAAKEIEFLADFPEAEKEWLLEMKVQLIVPTLGGSKDLVGLLLLGEKQSEEPYSQRDKNLLEAIASQVGVVYENSLLKEKVDIEEKIKKEVLSKLEEQNINLVKECPKCGLCFDSNINICDKDGAELILSLPVERIVENKYRLDKLLGKGGMGAVYKAEDLRLGRSVAVKMLRGNMFNDQDAIRRFEREAKTSAKLTHPNIVAIYDYGQLATEGAYLVMEMVTGLTLKSKLAQEKMLPPSLVAELFEQILDAIKAAHSSGIIHRDLKPDNVLITEISGRKIVKILDFGIAKIKPTNKVDPNSLTLPGTIMGTFGYMPPEQFSGEDVDERADIFALGVMIIESLTGTKPFIGKTLYEIMGTMLKKPYHLPGNLPEIKNLDLKLQKCITPDPENRFSSIDEMLAEVIPAIRNCSPNAFLAPNKLPSSESDTVKIQRPDTNKN